MNKPLVDIEDVIAVESEVTAMMNALYEQHNSDEEVFRHLVGKSILALNRWPEDFNLTPLAK